MKNTLALTLAALLLPIPCSAEEKLNPVDLLLKARGLQALERIEKLVKKNGESKGKNLSKKEKCDWKLEGLFFGFAHPEMSKIVKKAAKMGLTAYNFPLMVGDDSKIIAQVQYKYLPDKPKPVVVTIASVAEGAAANLIPSVENVLFVATEECTYAFPVDDPLKISVEAN